MRNVQSIWLHCYHIFRASGAADGRNPAKRTMTNNQYNARQSKFVVSLITYLVNQTWSASLQLNVFLIYLLLLKHLLHFVADMLDEVFRCGVFSVLCVWVYMVLFRLDFIFHAAFALRREANAYQPKVFPPYAYQLHYWHAKLCNCWGLIC